MRHSSPAHLKQRACRTPRLARTHSASTPVWLRILHQHSTASTGTYSTSPRPLGIDSRARIGSTCSLPRGSREGSLHGITTWRETHRSLPRRGIPWTPSAEDFCGARDRLRPRPSPTSSTFLPRDEGSARGSRAAARSTPGGKEAQAVEDGGRVHVGRAAAELRSKKALAPRARCLHSTLRSYQYKVSDKRKKCKYLEELVARRDQQLKELRAEDGKARRKVCSPFSSSALLANRVTFKISSLALKCDKLHPCSSTSGQRTSSRIQFGAADLAEGTGAEEDRNR